MSVGFLKSGGHLYFKAVDDSYNVYNRVIYCNKFSAAIINCFAYLGLASPTIKQKDFANKTHHINYNDSIDWILRNDPLSEKKNLKKMNRKELSVKLGEVLKKKMALHRAGLEKKACEGSHDAMFKLGMMNYKGLGMQKSEKDAIEWLGKAVIAGNRKAVRKLRKNPDLMTKVEKGNGEIQYQIGKNSATIEFAHDQYKKAANLGHPEAQAALGRIYFDGVNLERRDYEKAYMWSKKAAKQGNVIGFYTLGKMYEQGAQVEKNVEKALRYYQKSAYGGNTTAAFKLGQWYQGGENVTQSHQEAFKFFKIAALNGCDAAAYLVAEYLRTGKEICIDPDLEKAIYYYAIAANHGSQPALARLKEMNSEIVKLC